MQFYGTKFGDIALPTDLDVTAENSIVVSYQTTQHVAAVRWVSCCCA